MNTTHDGGDTAHRVVVIGGGATGTGIARDLALRGVGVTLVERGTLTDGTTGRTHGHLHSGGRYAVSDQKSARDCMQETEILTEIAAHCIEETGGLFVQLEGDSDEYFQAKLDGCAACGIPTEVISREEALTQEPYLTKRTKRAIRVPDGAIDPFRLCVANAADAIEHGARIETHSEVVDIHEEGERVTGVTIRRQGPNHRGEGIEGDEVRIEADHVVSATGAWAGQLAEMIDIDVEMAISKGAMVVTNVRQVDTVINRCLPKGDGDTIIPHETTVLLGANDDQVADPDDYPEEQWEIDMMIDLASEMVPVIEEARMIRAYWGVRPLFDPDTETEPNSDSEADIDSEPDDDGDPEAATRPANEGKEMGEITRDYTILDHAERDDVSGFTTIVGGKLTTYREMAEAVSDHVCDVFGVAVPCSTHERALPGSRDPAVLDDYMDRFGLRSPIAKRSAKRLGEKAPKVLDTNESNPVVCGCEAVTRAEIQECLSDTGADLNAVRIRTRASMGNCQGGFCAHRMAAELYPTHGDSVARDSSDELYQERWKGQRHTLWGEQLSQVMLNQMLHATTMNRDADPSVFGTDIDFGAFDSGAAHDIEGSARGD